MILFNRHILSYLKEWKVKKHRKPLILRGARQTGKTSVLKYFAQKYFRDLVYINLEKSEDHELFRDIRSLTEFEKIVDIILKKEIIPGRTLLFLDEIQNAPNLIGLLRFFYEERPEWHVAAAGSLLETVIEKEGLAMPVGRVEYAYVHPLTFFEFLEAVGEDRLLGSLREISIADPLPATLHARAMRLFQDYTLVGGMPEAVALYAQKRPQKEINSLYSSLLTAYADDAYKYATRAEAGYIRHVIERSPFAVGERITYEKFGGSAFRSREMSAAFATLGKTMLIRQAEATDSAQLPLIGRGKRAKKLLFLDSGFVNFRNNLQSEYIRLRDLGALYRGKIAEQIVGQNILATGEHAPQPLYYWAREKPSGSAEVDFCLAHEGRILGVEVKSGHSARLKSLLSLGRAAADSRLVRIYGGELKKELISEGREKFPVLSLPFYLVNRLFDLYR